MAPGWVGQQYAWAARWILKKNTCAEKRLVHVFDISAVEEATTDSRSFGNISWFVDNTRFPPHTLDWVIFTTQLLFLQT